MKIKAHEAVFWPGGRGLFRVTGTDVGTASLSHVEQHENGNRVRKPDVAMFQIPGEKALYLGPGEISVSVTDAMGGAIPFEASFEPVVLEKSAQPTIEQRVKALEAK